MELDVARTAHEGGLVGELGVDFGVGEELVGVLGYNEGELGGYGIQKLL